MFLFISHTHVGLTNLCVTLSLGLLALGIILFPISCMHIILSADNIMLSYLLSLCCVHMLYMLLSLTLSHKISSLRSSFAQKADGHKQDSEPTGHIYHIVRLILVAKRGFTNALP